MSEKKILNDIQIPISTPDDDQLSEHVQHPGSPASTTGLRIFQFTCTSNSPHSLVSYHKMDHGRDPCPWVILNDFGGAFAMGGEF
jgi:hypothetical protein